MLFTVNVVVCGGVGGDRDGCWERIGRCWIGWEDVSVCRIPTENRLMHRQKKG